MKRILLVPALATLLFTSCKDDPELVAPEIATIEFSKERIAAGQLITITPTVTDKDTDQANLIYKWTSSDGLSSNEQEAKWMPSSTGTKTITLTVDDLNTKISKDVTVDVIEPDFRRGLWGDKQEDIIASEEFAKNEIEIFPISQGVDAVVTYGDVENSLDAYFIQNGLFVQGETIFLTEYATAEFNQYFVNFNTQRDRLTTKYGAARETATSWSDDAAEAAYATKPELWGKAFAEGALVSHAMIWSNNTTGIILYLERDETEGEVFSGIVYFQLQDGRMANPKVTDLSTILNHAKELKASKLLK